MSNTWDFVQYFILVHVKELRISDKKYIQIFTHKGPCTISINSLRGWRQSLVAMGRWRFLTWLCDTWSFHVKWWLMWWHRWGRTIGYCCSYWFNSSLRAFCATGCSTEAVAGQGAGISARAILSSRMRFVSSLEVTCLWASERVA